MENRLQEVSTYSFFDFEEMMFFIKKDPNFITNINIQKQVEVLDGNEIDMWIVSIVKDFI